MHKETNMFVSLFLTLILGSGALILLMLSSCTLCAQETTEEIIIVETPHGKLCRLKKEPAGR